MTKKSPFESVKGFVQRLITNITFWKLKKEHFVQKQSAQLVGHTGLDFFLAEKHC